MVAGVFSALLAGCGGGGAAGGATASLSGVAAYGAPMAGATIVITDSTGKTVTATAAADGGYTADVSGFNAPLLITAAGDYGNSVKKYVALLDAMPASGAAAIANVTPLTNALAAMVSSDGVSPDEFAKDIGKLRNLDGARLASALGNLQAAMADVLADAGLPATFDPTRTAFHAERGNAADTLLDTVRVTQSDLGVMLSNARVALSYGAAGGASVTLKGLATSGVARLPKPDVAATDMAAFDGLLAQLNACLALPPAARVGVDGSGDYTPQGVCAAMSAFSQDYLQDGFTFSRLWGARLASIPAGATFAMPELLTFMKNEAGDQTALLRLTINTDQGGAIYAETARKNGATWAFSGNQRKYDASITTALARSTDVSTNGSIAPLISGYADSGKNVGKFSSYSSLLFFSFNQPGADVYAVRVTGPGLPAAGIVLARSSACGASDYLAFYRNDGVLPAASASATPTTTSGNGWVIDVKNVGSDYLGSDFYKQSQGISATGLPSASVTRPMASVAVDTSTIPEFARYKWEVFTEAAGSTAADVFYSRVVTRPLAASFGAKQAWAELSADAMRYVQPNVAATAGELTQGTVSWSLPAGAPPVIGAYISGFGVDPLNPANTPYASMRSGVPRAASSQMVMYQDVNGAGRSCGAYRMASFSATSGYRRVGTVQHTDSGMELQQSAYHQGR